MKSGIANLPLHYGKTPYWLFSRMTKLARSISLLILQKWGSEEFLRRLADPFWFQSLGCVLGFDWHSSGLSTTTLGALKEGLKNLEGEVGFFICGGKGKSSLKTPQEIRAKSTLACFSENQARKLTILSRLAAKVDSACVQDGYQLYHHNFLFDKDGNWVVIQQGMNEGLRMAWRYHWLSSKIENPVIEPHSGILAWRKGEVLDLTAKRSEATQKVEVALAKNSFRSLQKDLFLIERVKRKKILKLPRHHPIYDTDLKNPRILRTLFFACELKPKSFKELLLIQGLGAKTLRALTLVAELIYGAKPSYEDPARYSFAHGGKDGYPFPIERELYDKTIDIFERAIKKSRIDSFSKREALFRLNSFSCARKNL